MNLDQRHAQGADAGGGHELQVVEQPPEGGATVLAVTGEVDIATAPTLRTRLNAVLDTGVRKLVVDMTGVDFIDSVALAVLVNAERRIGDAGRLAFVVAPDSYGMLIFEASGIDAVLQVFETRSEAVAYVTA